MDSIFLIKNDFPKKSGVYRLHSLYNNFTYIGSAFSLKKRMKDYRNDLKAGRCHIHYLQNIYNKHPDFDIQVEFLVLKDYIARLNSKEHRELVQIEEDKITELSPEFNTIKTPTTQVNNPSTSKKVYQYDLRGNFIREWDSGRQVLRELEIQVQNGLRNGVRSSGGFQWSLNRVENLGVYKHQSGRKVKVKLVKKEKTLEFNSILDCCNNFGGGKSIYQKISYCIKSGRLFNGYEIIAS